ncbi:MAG TPA: hypothetical protein VHL14_02320, partial [Steroidobacteraceae bacterium]|nr:hypothetical protein [Steroidobacteraceae bacterium]
MADNPDLWALHGRITHIVFDISGSSLPMHPCSNWTATCLRATALILLAVTSLAAQADENQKPWESEPPPYIFEDKMRLQVSIWNSNIDTVV